MCQHASTLFINSRQTLRAYQWSDSAVILSANTWLEFRSAIERVSSERGPRGEMFYLHTWSRNKSSCDTRNVFGNFSFFSGGKAFDSRMKSRRNEKDEVEAKRSEESSTNLFLFPSICYIEFGLLLRLRPLLWLNNKKRAEGILRGEINAQDIVLLIFSSPLADERFLRACGAVRDTCGRKTFGFDSRWRERKLNQLTWQMSLFSACPPPIARMTGDEAIRDDGKRFLSPSMIRFAPTHHLHHANAPTRVW